MSQEVLIESNLEISENDFDLIVMFFESKKQSGGGDTLSSELLNDRKFLKIVYEQSEAKKRVLEKKYFKFKHYLFRSFEINVNGYKSDKYELNKCHLIIRDILIEQSEDDPEHSIVRMYAEHLSPDNDINLIQKSNLFKNTYYITFKNHIDKDQLQSRYNKKPKLRNKEITLLDSFNTRSFLISSTVKKASKTDFDLIKSKIIDEIQKIDSNPPVNYFFDLNDKFILFQFDNESFMNTLIDWIKLNLKDIMSDMLIENCYNFQLIDHLIEPETVVKTATETKKRSEITTKETVNQIKEAKPSKVSETKSEIKQEEPIKYDKKAKSETKKEAKQSSDEIRIEEVKMDHIYLNNLIKTETENEIILNDEAPLSIGLKNCSQLRIDLDKILKPLNTQLSFNKKNKYKSLSIKFDKELKSKIKNMLKDYAQKNFSYKIVFLPPKVFNDYTLMESLLIFVPKLNKQFPAVYLEVKNNSIQSYGYPKSLDRVLEKNCEILKELSSSKKVQTESKKEEKEPKNEIQKEAKVPKSSKLENKLAKNSSKNDLKSKLLNDSNLITLFDSWQSINSLPVEKEEIIQNPKLLLIDSNVYKNLSICLLKCYQISIDFMNDLNMISPKCQLIQIERKGFQNELSHGIMINSDDEKYVESYKDQIIKLMNFYEKNRLKHVYIIIDEKLKLEQFFPDLISNFSSKNELDDLKTILEMIYNTDKVVHAQLVDKSMIEIYGYTNAVQNYDTYVYDILNKTLNKINNSLNNILAFKLTVKENPKLALFFKFDGIYFNDLISQLTGLEAFGIKLDDQRTIHFACSNKKLKNNPKKMDKYDDIYNWRQQVDNFINDYLDSFSIELINMPFERTSEKCKNILYDKNTIDISWLSENQIEVLGIKDEINSFKQKILF